jgi:RNA polymerase sigma factor for flagellar operon FliA
MSTNAVNPAVSQLVVQNYFNMVQAIARRIKRRLPAHVDVDDLVQSGMIGLLEASRRYDVSRKVDFSSYANARITGAILDELRKRDTCSRQDRRTARQVEDVKSRLRAVSGQEPSREQIAEAVGMGLEEYGRTLHRLESGKQTSAQCWEQHDDVADEISRLPSKDENPYEICSKREDFKHLRSFVGRLKSRQREVLELHYFKEKGLKEIGLRLGVGEARISQIHKQAVLELRKLVATSARASAPRVSSMVQ